MTRPDLKVVPERAPRELLSATDAEDAILLNACTSADVLHEARATLREEHFEANRNRVLWVTVCEILEAGVPLSLPAVLEALRKTDRLAIVGGATALQELAERAPAISPRTAGHLAKVVREAWARRQVVFNASRASTRAVQDGADVGGILADARGELDAILTELATDNRIADSGAVVRAAVDRAESAQTRGTPAERSTGFPSIDRQTGGLHIELALLGARPGMGKTSLATAIALNVAAEGQFAYIASLETTKEILGMRMVCAEAHVEFKRAMGGQLDAVAWARFVQASNYVASQPFVVDDTKSPTVSELWARVRRAKNAKRKKLGLVVIDYIQLLRAPRRGMASREQEIAENARALIAMSQDLECPVLALAQLSREAEKRDGHRPRLSDLRESGELEQAARTVFLLYRKDYYTRKREQHTGQAEVIVAKQNNGPAGVSAWLHFTPEYARFDNLEAEPGGDE